MNIGRSLLTLALLFVLACSEEPKQEEKAVALDGPDVSEVEVLEMREAASLGNAASYETLMVLYGNEQRYDDALRLAVNFAEHDSRRAMGDICELAWVYGVELDSEAIIALGGSREVCDLQV
ncbi:hypothetical protein [Qipengyuania nanhaisediminis]|uniref:hypothetical protein n=1 Tax=Qipengyuania nanhaisediminis TaxID=604088 RepID=UPI000B82FFAE|nr:hypothetical protein [Qipengyuania nanhaisediminis]